jgi:hypothetical protein
MYPKIRLMKAMVLIVEVDRSTVRCSLMRAVSVPSQLRSFRRRSA